MFETARTLLTGILLVLGAAAPLAADELAASDPFTEDLLADLARAGDKLVQLAEAVPEESYGWRPNDEVRTVSEVFMHVVGTNMLLPPALGAAPPQGVEIPANPFSLMLQWEADVTAKEKVIHQLRASLEYATAAIRSIPASAHDDQVQLFGPPASKRAYLLILLTHAHEHLGQAIAYARSVGVTPPWSGQPPAEVEEAREADAGTG